MKTQEFKKEAIIFLNNAAEKDFNEAMERLQTDAKNSFTWVAEEIISSSYKKDVYGRMLLDLEKRSFDEVLEYFKNQLSAPSDIKRSSNQFDILESVIQMETRNKILNDLNWSTN